MSPPQIKSVYNYATFIASRESEELFDEPSGEYIEASPVVSAKANLYGGRIEVSHMSS
jgi:hypothetical protein